MIDEQYIVKNDFALLENSLNPQRSSFLFWNQQFDIVIHDKNKLHLVYDAIDIAQKQGLFTVGYLAYDQNIDSDKPLACFVFYKDMLILNTTQAEDLVKFITSISSKINTFVYDVDFSLTKTEYAKGFEKVMSALSAGDSYQLNYTGKYKFKLQGDPFKLYKQLRQHQAVEYGAYLPFKSGHVLSFSPELFFTKKQGHIHVRPMKGTAQRGRNEETDRQQKEFLAQDIKNKSENLIIVDLLRNDLSVIAETASINVDKLFHIESYQSVFQMVSQISAKIDKSIPFNKLIKALFPCGSITGAPKKRTMQLISAIEKESRGIYTGCIGYILPNNDISFNVAIRTLFLKNNSGYLGVGGGITTRSNVDDEWNEMHLKAKFFTNMKKDFQLIETIKFDGDKLIYLQQHLRRLVVSAKSLSFQCNVKEISKSLNDYIKLYLGEMIKIRILLYSDGIFEISHDKFKQIAHDQKVKLYLSDQPIDQRDKLWQYKTNSVHTRGLYQAITERLSKLDNFDDVLFYNQLDEITETSIYNIIIQTIDDRWLTPPTECGLLPGIYRQMMIEENNVEQTIITREMLKHAKQLWVCNSVRGLQRAELCCC